MGDMSRCSHGGFSGYCDLCNPNWEADLKEFRTMTFEEWLDGNEVVSELKPAWIADAHIVWDAATLAEREACAKVCEELIACDEYDPGESFAEAIRNRSKEG